ncbi:uncharacterized protein LOC133716822 [Rosa rugosa]|uniref:uncharacterized protein LOC133716822 n=1 Tax=Rosa rugosa TaxID=74645 RepID=UPI002B40CFF6|nr:uncharacterized protein LOC133716822 [Rosa rugosa]
METTELTHFTHKTTIITMEKGRLQVSRSTLTPLLQRSEDVDLTPITNKLWKRFFERDFGGKATDEVIQKMKIKKMSFKWSELYEAKSKRIEEDEKEVGERLKKLYEKEAARKQSRQVKVLDKVPPSSSSNKTTGSKKESKLMRKLRKQHLNYLEVRNKEAMKMKRTAATCSGLIRKPRTSIKPMNVF